MGRDELDVSIDRLLGVMDRLLPATPDDVCVTREGHRLDTPDKVIGFIRDLNRRLDDPSDHSLDLA